MKKVELQQIFKERYAKTEAFKTLRTNLLFSGKDVKVITITSCAANEGKSSMTIELAKNLAQVGKRVLLLDADLRKSVIVSKYTNAVGISGLSEYLSGQKTLDDVLYSTQFEGFDIIFAGQYPPNPVDLLGNDTFKDLLVYGREHYDYVLLDTPPLGLVIDAAVTCSLSDGALIVISENRISYRFAQLVKEQIEMSGCSAWCSIWSVPVTPPIITVTITTGTTGNTESIISITVTDAESTAPTLSTAVIMRRRSKAERAVPAHPVRPQEVRNDRRDQETLCRRDRSGIRLGVCGGRRLVRLHGGRSHAGTR